MESSTLLKMRLGHHIGELVVVSPIVALGISIVVFTLAWYVYSLTYELFFSPLSHFPGPRLWAISRIPYQLSLARGHNHLDMTALHEKYGPAVRIAPNELAFISAQAFRDIYGFRAGQKCFPRDKLRYVTPPNGVNHLIGPVDDASHSRQRRLLATPFSERSLKEQEPMIQKYVDMLIGNLRQQAKVQSGKRETKADIMGWLNYTTFDIMGDLVFGEPFDCLENSELHPWVRTIFDSIKFLLFAGIVHQFPVVASVLTPLIPKRLTQKISDHFDLARQKVDRRLDMQSDTPDIVSVIQKNGLSESDGKYDEDEKTMSRAELHSNAFILMLAGSETSATLLSGAVFYLCTHPAVLTRLVDEIRSAFVSDKEITFAQSAKLRYLSAVIEESLRCYPPLVTSLARVVPNEGDTVDGHWVPGGTTVATHHYASYRSTFNFAMPDSFIPERWLGDDPRFDDDKKDALQPFIVGPRNCLGKTLAYAEIRLILCKLLYNFDIELCPESIQWTDQKVYFMWDKPPLMVTLTDKLEG